VELQHRPDTTSVLDMNLHSGHHQGDSPPRRASRLFGALLILGVLGMGATQAKLAPNAVLPDGSSYYGPLVDGLLHGQGRLSFLSGAHYEGGFKAGLYHGQGREVLADGCLYEGQFREGLYHGLGTLRLATGAVYTGNFEKGLFSGQGKLVYPTGEVLVASFRNGHAEGQGQISMLDGSRYEGELSLTQMHGEGRYVDAMGDVYEGQFAHGTFTGHGIYRSTHGGYFEGTFKSWKIYGEGVMALPTGDRYEGHFENGEPTQLQRYTSAAGDLYEGEFEGWAPHGAGILTGTEGKRYEGLFENGRFHGQGTLTLANGDTYVGGFAFGEYHGEGMLTRASPEQDQEAIVSGEWRYGSRVDPAAERAQHSRLEQSIYQQGALLEASLTDIEPGNADAIELYLLAVGGDGSQAVFRREVDFVARDFAERFATAGRTIKLVNDRRSTDLPLATQTSIERSLGAIAQRMDKDQDILFLYLTSHGSKEHELVLSQPGLRLNDLPASELRALLDNTGIRYRVIVVSACYAGGFLDPLRDPNSLVITASRHDRRSFGCADDSDFTYFGRALLKQAIPSSPSLVAAFDVAKTQVHELEVQEEKEPSLPQMEAPTGIVEQLARWRKNL